MDAKIVNIIPTNRIPLLINKKDRINATESITNDTKKNPAINDKNIFNPKTNTLTRPPIILYSEFAL